MNIPVVSVVLSAFSGKNRHAQSPKKLELDRNFKELNLPDPVALLRSNTEVCRYHDRACPWALPKAGMEWAVDPEIQTREPRSCANSFSTEIWICETAQAVLGSQAKSAGRITTKGGRQLRFTITDND